MNYPSLKDHSTGRAQTVLAHCSLSRHRLCVLLYRQDHSIICSPLWHQGRPQPTRRRLLESLFDLLHWLAGMGSPRKPPACQVPSRKVSFHQCKYWPCYLEILSRLVFSSGTCVKLTEMIQRLHSGAYFLPPKQAANRIEIWLPFASCLGCLRL